MKTLLCSFTAILCFCSMFLLVGCGYEKIEPGHVGIKVKLVGDNRGVQGIDADTGEEIDDSIVVVSGRVWYNSIVWDVVEFPTYLQTINWTQDPNEGSPVDESITFNSVEGSSMNVDISVAYSFEAAKVPDVYVKFRKNPEEIMDVFIRSKVRDAFSRHASTMKVMDIFGEKKQMLLEDVKKDLNDQLNEDGINFEMVSFIGKPRVDKRVEDQINMVIAASQKAIEAENKVKEIEAEAKQHVAQAEGEAEAILAVAKANAEANAVLTESLSPELLQYEGLQKWNGILPAVTSGGTLPFITINPASYDMGEPTSMSESDEESDFLRDLAKTGKGRKSQ